MAAEIGLTPRSIRYYEEIGLLLACDLGAEVVDRYPPGGALVGM